MTAETLQTVAIVKRMFFKIIKNQSDAYTLWLCSSGDKLSLPEKSTGGPNPILSKKSHEGSNSLRGKKRIGHLVTFLLSMGLGHPVDDSGNVRLSPDLHNHNV